VNSLAYLGYARECAQWARKAATDDDHELWSRMAQAWVYVARAEDDVAREIQQIDWTSARSQ
jgi:hypothetical protein